MSSVQELTPSGRGGVSILAVRGEAADERVFELAPSLRGALSAGGPPRLVRLLAKLDGGGEEELDEALVWRRADGAIEVHLHGSPVLVARVLGLLGDTVKDAPNGLVECARALEARAAEALATAPCLAASRLLLAQAEGALRRELEHWLRLDSAEARLELAGRLRERGRVARWLVEPARVVLAGPVNAGKSTLFNLLVGEERVVVSDSAGTTRDLIEERVLMGDFAVDLIDTAGAREASGEAAAVEAAGQRQALLAGRNADLIFWVARGERPPSLGVPMVEFLGRADEPLEDGGTAAAELSPLARPREAVALLEQAFQGALELPDSKQLRKLMEGATPFDAASRELVRDLCESPELASTSQAVSDALS